MTKVHLVYENQYLLDRDRKEFAKYWTVEYLKDRVEYHVGLQFEHTDKEVIIFDEVDSLMFSHPALFEQTISKCFAVGFTATPDNNKTTGIEKSVVQSMKFKQFDYAMEGVNDIEQVIDTVEELQVSLDNLVDVVVKQLSSSAVLLLCTPAFKELIDASDISYTSVDDVNNIDTQLLRSLDKRCAQTQLYRLIIATQQKPGMRGIDYRCYDASMDLIVAASFENYREAIQGLHRVGRFGDRCRRYLVTGVQLIDKDLQNTYNSMLIASMKPSVKTQQNLSMKPVAKPQQNLQKGASQQNSIDKMFKQVLHEVNENKKDE